MRKRILLIILVFVLLAGCGKTSANDQNKLLVSAASSLTDVMKAAEEEFQKKHPDIELIFNFGSSGKLRNQIQQGAPVDLFLSASAEDMKILLNEELILHENARIFAGNRLVIASASELEESEAAELLSSTEGVIAIGEPESVPIGFYTKKALEGLGLWGPLSGNMIFAKDARQVLSYIESGNADLGIVYSSDADRSATLKTIADLPQDGLDIVYPAGIAKNAENDDAAEQFLAFLVSSEGQKLFEDFGFSAGKGAFP